MTALELALQSFQPHVVSVAMIAARLIPVAFLCPLFGGTHAPTHVKLGVVLSLATFLHWSAGIGLHGSTGTAELLGVVVKELGFGLALGLLAALPFDAARMAGRFVDLFRGSSAEAALPMAGTKESASAEGVFHLLLALCAAGAGMPLVIGALARSFGVVGLGQFAIGPQTAEEVLVALGGAFSTALAIGAPVAALSLTIDAGLGLAARALPSMNLQDTGAPLRIMVGAAALLALIGVIAERLQLLVVDHTHAMAAMSLAGP